MEKQIRVWMSRNAHRFVDPKTNLVNYTALTEAWDCECSTGSATLDPDHVAWTLAIEVGELYEDRMAKEGRRSNYR